MKRILKPVAVMFATYTSIPMPQFVWDGDSTRLAIGFFPLAGIVIGFALWCWFIFCQFLRIGDILFSAVAAAIPILITGGIHLDGYCDTVDALSSYQSRERKLEIMKDPNAGAFAVIYCGVYLLLYFGLLSQARDFVPVAAFGFILSRSLSAVNAVTIQNARGGKGMLAGFTNNAHKHMVLSLCAIFGAAACVGMIFCGGIAGVTAVIGALAVTVWYRRMVGKTFGGATGDTSGFFLQITELFVLAGAVTGGFM